MVTYPASRGFITNARCTDERAGMDRIPPELGLRESLPLSCRKGGCRYVSVRARINSEKVCFKRFLTRVHDEE